MYDGKMSQKAEDSAKYSEPTQQTILSSITDGIEGNVHSMDEIIRRIDFITERLLDSEAKKDQNKETKMDYSSGFLGRLKNIYDIHSTKNKIIFEKLDFLATLI